MRADRTYKSCWPLVGGWNLNQLAISAPVWILDTGRPGERAQCRTLAQALGLPFRVVPLGPGFTPPERWPDTTGLRLILSFGNAVQAACDLREICAVRPLIVHIGRPSHVAADDLDLIIVLPQDDYPYAPNVVKVGWPFNSAPLFPETEGAQEERRGGTIVVYGGPSRQFRLGVTETDELLRFSRKLANVSQEPLHIITSPRTPARAVEWLRERAGMYGATLHLFRPNDDLFRTFLQTGNRFVVTADSASMLAEAWRSRAPVWLFPLPHRETLMTRLQQGADAVGLRPVRYRLVRRGLLGSGAGFRRWHRALLRSGEIRCASMDLPEEDLLWSPERRRADTDLARCQRRILALPGLVPETV